MTAEEDGDKDREAGGAVEEVTEGEVEDEGGGGTPQPRILSSVPGRVGECDVPPDPDVGDGEQGEQVADGADGDHEETVDNEEDAVLGDVLREAAGVVAHARGGALDGLQARLLHLRAHHTKLPIKSLMVCAHGIFGRKDIKGSFDRGKMHFEAGAV